MSIADNIAAIITGTGAAGVGIVRVSGSNALDIGAQVYKGYGDLKNTESHRIIYGHVYDEQNDKYIDEALFLIMKEPTSFTGENVVEIQAHGGIVVLRQVLDLVLTKGARLAEPGEFSKRAFLNGRLDLSQAEAIMDIVNAKTDKSLETAVGQLQGHLSKQINKFREGLLELIAYLEADIDFPEDDIDRLTITEQQERINKLIKKIDEIIETQKRGKIIREGLKLAIVGKPNVGKSSLLNALLQENRAIVTDIPGTTRDAIEEFINIKGIPVQLIDTAGIRETTNIVEQIGVKKSKEYIANVDLVLFVLDITSGFTEEDRQILDILNDRKTIVVINKVDLLKKEDHLQKIIQELGSKPRLKISVLENTGLRKLQDYIVEMFFQGEIDFSNQVLITNIRHLNALQNSLSSLQSAIKTIENGLPGDFLIIDLKEAWDNLGKITGETVEEDILDQIFSQFCLGK